MRLNHNYSYSSPSAFCAPNTTQHNDVETDECGFVIIDIPESQLTPPPRTAGASPSAEHDEARRNAHVRATLEGLLLPTLLTHSQSRKPEINPTCYSALRSCASACISGVLSSIMHLFQTFRCAQSKEEIVREELNKSR